MDEYSAKGHLRTSGFSRPQVMREAPSEPRVPLGTNLMNSRGSQTAAGMRCAAVIWGRHSAMKTLKSFYREKDRHTSASTTIRCSQESQLNLHRKRSSDGSMAVWNSAPGRLAVAASWETPAVREC